MRPAAGGKSCAAAVAEGALVLVRVVQHKPALDLLIPRQFVQGNLYEAAVLVERDQAALAEDRVVVRDIHAEEGLRVRQVHGEGLAPLGVALRPPLHVGLPEGLLTVQGEADEGVQRRLDAVHCDVGVHAHQVLAPLDPHREGAEGPRAAGSGARGSGRGRLPISLRAAPLQD
jgi:hypothetical protein